MDWRYNLYGTVKKYNIIWLGSLVHERMCVDDNIKMDRGL